MDTSGTETRVSGLRSAVEAAWASLAAGVDALVAAGRPLDRELLLDLAQFAESAMPAVRAYERAVARSRS